MAWTPTPPRVHPGHGIKRITKYFKYKSHALDAFISVKLEVSPGMIPHDNGFPYMFDVDLRIRPFSSPMPIVIIFDFTYKLFQHNI